MCPVQSAAVVADFEDARAEDVGVPSGTGFTGPWYAVASTGTPTKVIGASTDPTPTCNKYALHGTVAGPIATGGYGQLRGDFLADSMGVMAEPYSAPEDISAYDAIQFDVEVGPGTTTYPITFEVIDQASTPVTDPTSMNAVGGTATIDGVDEYNHRGWPIWSLASGWQTVTVPFALLVPHWFPSPTTSTNPNGCAATGLCEAPTFHPKTAMGMQFAINPDQDPNGSFDLWVDNVTLVSTANAGLTPPGMTMPTWSDAAYAHCGAVTGAKGEYLLYAYNNWKNQFVKGTPGSQRYVYSPEIQGGTVVSEGIGYGLLLSVYFNDQSLFNDLWSYWTSHAWNGTSLMTWISNGSSSGTATDADEDAAFALLQAAARWGTTGTLNYTSLAATVIGQIWAHDIDTSVNLPNGGSNYANGSVLNPSYFAPAYYPLFANADKGHAWTSVVTSVYSALANITGSDGLPSAWCSGTTQKPCSTPAVNTNSATDEDYQYDAHRIPFRVGVDYCWNGTAQAATFLDKNSQYFSNIAGANGIGRVQDEYTATGGAVSGSAPNSMSIIGTSGVGAMHSATYAGYATQAWQLVLDGLNRGKLDVTAGSKSGYSYYNSTIGLMTALMMSGNFAPL
jgi:endo-1,4-beta-D-glucanase Y